MIRMVYYSILRMIREYNAIILLFVLPLAVITLLTLVAGDFFHSDELSSRQYIAMTMIITFQIFGGNYAMGYIHQDLVKSRKWRLHSLPISTVKYSFSLVIASTLFSALQGILLVLYSRFVFGVEWGHYGWVILFLIGISLLSQFVHLTMVFSAKEFSMAERFTEIYGVGFILLAGIIFPVPEWAPLEWVNTYINPITVAQSGITSLIAPTSTTSPTISLMLLLLHALVFLCLTVLLGRRKLA